MKRVVTCIVALLSAYNGALGADKAVFVEKGKARSVREIGDRWTVKEGSLVCVGMGNYLVAGKAIGTGDFQVRARLSLERLDGTAASLVIGGNHFGFDGRGKKFFVEGPAFGPTRLLSDAGKVITPGKPFDVEVTRKGKRLSFHINGKEIYSASYRLAPVCAVGFRPWRATMRLYDFSANGSMTSVTEAAIKTMQQDFKNANGRDTKMADLITVGGIKIDLASPPKPLVTRRDLGLVTARAVDGRLVHDSKKNLYETRATITPGGDYLLMFPEGSHYGGKKGKVNTMIAYRSCDKGKTWTGPKVAFDIDYSQHGFIPLIPRGTKRIYAFGTQPIEGKREGRENCPIGFRWSDDDGHTWSDVRLIRPKNNPNFLGMSVMRMCETDAGTWLLGSHEGQWKRTPKTPVITRAYVLRSDDRGKTWMVLPDKRPGGWYLEEFERMDEPRPINLGGGKAMILARTCEGHLWEIRSEDDGRTWSQPKPTTLVHPDAPPMLFHHPDGKTLIAFHHNRHSGSHFKHTDRSEIWVSLSSDHGRTWSEPRFVFANALAATSNSPWYDHQCSYIDAFADGQDLHIFVPHRWRRALHLHLKASDLNKLPTKAELGLYDFKTQFLTFCDLAAAEFNKEITRFADRDNADPVTHHMPFFEDAHAVRALAVAYDMTSEQKYLDACRQWSEKIIEYQSRMIPAGAYYMNHSRAPGEDQGQWNVADSGSIAMGILATAIRCNDPAEKAKYLKSVKAFARLVMENYVGPEGGISNGLWPVYDGQWWCSTATFGTMTFVLYEETGDKKYLKVAKGALDWMTHQDFREVKPITFQQRPSGIIFYCFELYATGLRYLKPGSRQYERAIRQIDLALDWMAKNQKTRGADVPDYVVRNVDMAGLPYLMYAFARQLPKHQGLTDPADCELRYIGDLLLRDGLPNVSRLMVWEVMTWGMMSYAERLRS
jgi:hypothetical protein